ncbi:MAG TPA: glycosyltransferase [Thermoanaerobaculia bacterium]|nr:glycosyltransferase [Thermoanaerobaculia bacterium]
MGERSLLLINYRSAALAARAIETARESSGSPIQVVIVDNSVEPAEADRIAAIDADVRIIADGNLGYAGGIRLGLPRCEGDLILIANPDIELGPGCIDRLAETVEQGAAVAGPAFFWDREFRWHMPPAETMSRGQKLAEIAAGRSRFAARRRDRARLRRRLRFWRRSDPAAVPALTGALLAVHRDWLGSTAEFDPRYPLYFEEIDFIRQVRRQGGRVMHVPAARCRHLYSQSAGRDYAAAAEKFAEAEELFHRKWHGGWFLPLVSRFQRPLAPVIGALDDLPIRLPGEPSRYVVELSPDRTFNMAAGCFPASKEIEVPREALESHPGSELFARAVDLERLITVGAWRLEVPAG